MSLVDLPEIRNYSDGNGNVIESPTTHKDCRVIIRGSNNRLVVGGGAVLNCIINLDCDNAVVIIGNHTKEKTPFKSTIRIGQDATVTIGDNVTCTSSVFISAVEGASVVIGDDCMFASGVVVRSDDAHPIFDIETGVRANPARNVTIGNHVWLSDRVAVLAGAEIGDGSVIGLGAVVKKRIPNNCIAVGVPAKVTKENIAWERPHLSLRKPFMKPDASTVQRSVYWNKTTD